MCVCFVRYFMLVLKRTVNFPIRIVVAEYLITIPGIHLLVASLLQ